jgi:hypothetical protein
VVQGDRLGDVLHQHRLAGARRRHDQGALANFENPDKIKHKVHFDNLTPLFPTQRFKLELAEPTRKDSSMSRTMR